MRRRKRRRRRQRRRRRRQRRASREESPASPRRLICIWIECGSGDVTGPGPSSIVESHIRAHSISFNIDEGGRRGRGKRRAEEK